MASDNFDVAKKLSSSHDRIIAKAKIRSKAKEDAKIAKEIEQFLRLLKKKDEDINKNPPKDSIQAAFRSEAKEVRDSVSSIFGKKWNTLFQRSHSSTDTYSRFGGSDIFEEELAAVIATIEAKATGSETINVDSHVVGSKLGNVAEIGRVLEKEEQQVITEFYQALKNNLNTRNSEEPGLYTKPVFRAAKVDVAGATFVGTAELDPAWEKLAMLFAGKTFSVKNYLYFEEKNKQNSLSLGTTDYYKALYSALSAAGYSDAYAKKLIFKGMVKITKNEDENGEITKHFYHMKYLYELTGLGLRDQDNERLDSVDFFIYNEPNTSNIYVRSTAEMIETELNQSDTSSPKLRKHIGLLRESFYKNLT